MNMRICVDCRKPISGRTDKKFCGDGCRSSYHNRMNNGDAKPVRLINMILIKNRKIIISLMKKHKEISVSEITLREMGFNFTHCTQMERSAENVDLCYCYEFLYYRLSDTNFKIERLEFE